MKAFILLSCVQWNSSIKVRPHHIANQAQRAGYRLLIPSLHESSSKCKTIITGTGTEVHLQYPIYHHFLAGKTLYCPESTEYLVKLAGEEKPIVWINAPYWNEIARELKASGAFIVYDVLDRFEHFEDLKRQEGKLLECHKDLLKTADLVLYTATTLQDYVRKAKRSFYLPNGCEYERWDLPLRRRNYAVAGYFGVMTYWLNVHVIKRLLSCGDFQTELYGPADSKIKKEFNVLKVTDRQYRGRIDYGELPGAVTHWNAGLIPFKNLPITKAANPNKFYEYAALGLPCIATDLPELRHLSGSMPELIRPYLLDENRPQKWLEAIRDAISTDSPEKIRARKEWAQLNTWETRWKTFEELLNVNA